MTLFSDAKLKLDNIARTISSLLDGDFPLDAGRAALVRLSSAFAELEKKLDRAQRLSDIDSVTQIVNNINVKVLQTLPVLGFILRSTNVRNAFEFSDPLQELAHRVLQGRPQLILSSEWDYVPFAWPQSLDDLRSYVLIGMPASEAASALLLPLAGHELGHAVWRNRGMGGTAQVTMQARCEELYVKNIAEFKQRFADYDPSDMLSKDVLTEAIALSAEYAATQAEELFADMFAYSLFGESYVYAFAYILSPGSGRAPSAKYPNNKTRIEMLRRIAAHEGQPALPAFEDLGFIPERPRGNDRELFRQRMAEESVSAITDGLWRDNLALLAESKVTRPSSVLSDKHRADFELGIPAHQPQCLGDITNAGWKFYNARIVGAASADQVRRETAALNEVMLKTIEVLEFRRRTE